MAKSRSRQGKSGKPSPPTLPAGTQPASAADAADADRTLILSADADPTPGRPADAAPAGPAASSSAAPPSTPADITPSPTSATSTPSASTAAAAPSTAVAKTGSAEVKKAELKGALRSREALRKREKVRGKKEVAAASGPTDFGGMAWEWIKSIGAAVLLFLVIRTFVITAYSIPSESMEETLLVGDYLMANNALFGATIPFTDVKLPALRDPRRGEIVVFRPTYNEPQIDVVKRVVGVPGDTLQMVDMVLYRNGRRAVEPFAHYDEGIDQPIEMEGFGIIDPNIRSDHYGAKNHLPILHPSVNARQYSPSRNNWGPIVVPAGHYWLMGDNRDQSLDSRFMGPVPRRVIRGKPLFIYYSYDKRDPDAGFPRFITAARWRRIGHGIN